MLDRVAPRPLEFRGNAQGIKISTRRDGERSGGLASLRNCMFSPMWIRGKRKDSSKYLARWIFLCTPLVTGWIQDLIVFWRIKIQRG